MASYLPRHQLHALVQGNSHCFLDVSSDPSAAQALMAELTRVAPAMPVVAVLVKDDPDVIMSFLRRGASEFLVAPFSDAQLAAVLAKLDEMRRGPNSPVARTFCVMPAKGGCGASTVAYNFAQEWKRRDKKRILLADLDTLAGTLSFFLKIKSNHSFVDVLLRSDEIDDDIWKAMVSTAQGLEMLLAPETLGEGMGGLADPSPIIEFAKIRYEVVVLDAGGVYGAWNVAQAQLADDLLLVTSCELTDVYGAERALFYLEQQGVERSKIRLVVNRYGRDAGVSPEIIGQALDMDVAQVISEDATAVHDALVEGKFVNSSSQFGKGIKGLTDLLAGKMKPSRAEPARAGLISLFSGTTP